MVRDSNRIVCTYLVKRSSGTVFWAMDGWRPQFAPWVTCGRAGKSHPATCACMGIRRKRDGEEGKVRRPSLTREVGGKSNGKGRAEL